jgi:hypothetical protein
LRRAPAENESDDRAENGEPRRRRREWCRVERAGECRSRPREAWARTTFVARACAGDGSAFERLPELLDEVARGRGPGGRILRECRLEDDVERRRQRRIDSTARGIDAFRCANASVVGVSPANGRRP